MRLDYYTLLCPEPIQLSIGTIKHPTLRDIGKISYQRFEMYQVYLKLTPEDYYKYFVNEEVKEQWKNLSDETKSDITLMDLILFEDEVKNTYLELFNFFFVERVVFAEDMFLVIDTDDLETPDGDLDLDGLNIVGMIDKSTLMDVLDILQQICCIKNSDPLEEAKPKFKNAKAKKMYEKMLKAKKKKEKKQTSINMVNLYLANIVSATASKNSGLNIVNIWDATLFQLYDQFGKTQNDDIHYIESVRVAVWGDEENKFDSSLWYKNNYDKN